MVGVMNGLDWIVSPKAPLCHRKLTPNLRWSIQLCWSCSVHVSYFLRSNTAFFSQENAWRQNPSQEFFISLDVQLESIQCDNILCIVARSILRLAGCKTHLDSDLEHNRILLAVVVFLRAGCAGSSSIRAEVAGEHGLRSGVVFRVGRWKPRPSDSCSKGQRTGAKTKLDLTRLPSAPQKLQIETLSFWASIHVCKCNMLQISCVSEFHHL